MLLNCINVEGIVDEGILKDVCLSQCKICDYNNYLYLNHHNNIKDIYQISLEPTLQSNRLINFKDENALILKGVTIAKILAVEDSSDNNIAYLQENIFFNFSFNLKLRDIDDIKIFILDACFNMMNNNNLHCSITYLFNFINEDSNKYNEENIVCNNQFTLIDITQEFT